MKLFKKKVENPTIIFKRERCNFAGCEFFNVGLYFGDPKKGNQIFYLPARCSTCVHLIQENNYKDKGGD